MTERDPEVTIAALRELFAPVLEALDTVETHGAIDEAGLQIRWGDFMPTQGHGVCDGFVMYYRSRHDESRLAFWRDVAHREQNYWDPLFVLEEDDDWNGVVPTEESAAFIRRGVAAFRAWRSEQAGLVGHDPPPDPR